MTIWQLIGQLMSNAVDGMHDITFFWGISLWDIMIGFIAIWDLSLILGDVFGSNDDDDELGGDIGL
ncbi:MAG: hypothetical protein WC888_05560 [Candidatus Izemoplasmatales bacterium]|jgi:hypothetical protein